jgi:hypothetical protein
MFIIIQTSITLYASEELMAQHVSAIESESEILQELNKSNREENNHTTVQVINKFLNKNSSVFMAAVCSLMGLYVSCHYKKENALAVVSTLCTILGLYFSYRNNYESLRLNRASFIIDKGAAAFKNLSLIDAEQYDQFAALGTHVNKD